MHTYDTSLVNFRYLHFRYLIGISTKSSIPLLNDENSVQPTDWRSSTKVTGNNCDRKCLVEKTPKIPAKKLIKTEGGANSSMRNSSNLPGLNSLNPKPPEEEMRQSLDTTRVLSMEWENEERSLAPKSDTSQKPSTSAVPKEIKQRVLIKRKKKGEGDVMKKTGIFRNISPSTTSSSKVFTEGKNVIKVSWEPLGMQTQHQE